MTRAYSGAVTMNNRVQTTFLTVAAICITFGAMQPGLAASPAELNSAIADYNARKYQGAIAKLQKVSAANRDNPHTHYYLGLSYQAIGNWSGAKREFKWNYDNSKDADVRYKSWAAFTALERAKRGPSGSTQAQSASTTSAVAPRKDPNYNSNWGSAATLDKPAQVLNGADYETVIVTPKSCGRR